MSEIDRKVYGLLVGSVIGDAAGGPVEFRDRRTVGDRLPGFRDTPDKTVDAAGLRRLSETFPMLPYAPIRMGQEPYGQWIDGAPAGTSTDDTRNKIVLLDALRAGMSAGSNEVTRERLAQAYLDFASRPEIAENEGWDKLCSDGFDEFWQSARWELGQRDLAVAVPSSRMWNGVGTCCGMMTLPPLAGLYPGDPERAYLAAYGVAFFDNGLGKDINAALVGAMAFALAQPTPGDSREERHAAWRATIQSLADTDPLRYGEIMFMGREAAKWIERGKEAAKDAGGSPAKLYRLIEEKCQKEHAWEAHFLLFQMVAIAEFCPGEPLAAMHLALDYGQDTDSIAQLLGAMYGAIYGPDIFPEPMRELVETRLEEQHGESLRDWVSVIRTAREAGE